MSGIGAVGWDLRPQAAFCLPANGPPGRRQVVAWPWVSPAFGRGALRPLSSVPRAWVGPAHLAAETAPWWQVDLAQGQQSPLPSSQISSIGNAQSSLKAGWGSDWGERWRSLPV